MLLAVTSQDDPTLSNRTVAALLPGPFVHELLDEQAVRDDIIAVLNANQSPILLIGHGREDSFIGHDNAPAISLGDAELFGGRQAFALACKTAHQLGPAIAQSNGIWLGYLSTIVCLISDEDHLQIFLGLLKFIADNFTSVVDEQSALAFLNELKARTDHALHVIDAQDTGNMEVFACVRQLIRRLRVWLPNAPQPIAHASAEPINI